LERRNALCIETQAVYVMSCRWLRWRLAALHRCPCGRAAKIPPGGSRGLPGEITPGTVSKRPVLRTSSSFVGFQHSVRQEVLRFRGEMTRRESCTACGRTGFTPCRKVRPQPSVRAGGERSHQCVAEQVSARCTLCIPDPLYALLPHRACRLDDEQRPPLLRTASA
jgi:hypothetical protein